MTASLSAGVYPQFLEGKPNASGVAQSLVGAVVESSKGVPGQVYAVTAQNLEKTLGKIISRDMVELYYLLKETGVALVSVAIGQQTGNVSNFPVMRFTNQVGSEITHETADFGTDPAAGATDYMVFWPKSGESGGELGVAVTDKTDDIISIITYRKNNAGTGVAQNSYSFSLDPDAVNLDGKSIYIDAVLADDPDIAYDVTNLALTALQVSETPVYFTGGSRTAAANEDFEAAWKVFEPESVPVDLLYTSSANTTSIGTMINVADTKKIQSFYDCHPLTADAATAVTFASTLNADTKRTSAHWNGFTCEHPNRTGSKIVLGLAWSTAAKCAKGYGIAPAGHEQPDHSGVIKNCKNVQFIHEITPDLPDTLKAARINYGKHLQGVNMVWEQTTRHPLATSIAYSKIKQNRIADLIVRTLVREFQKYVFMADDDNAIRKIGDVIDVNLKAMTSGSLPLLSLPKRQTEFTTPFSYEITPSPTADDLYHVKVWVCITGTVERLALDIIPIS